MDETPEDTAPKQDHRFKPGQSGNPAGKPLGARHKLGKAFLKVVLTDWQENGAKALADCRAFKPDVYVKVIADLLPKEVHVAGTIDHEHRAVSETTAWLAGMLGERSEGPLQEPLPH